MSGEAKEYIFLGLGCMNSQTRRFMLIINIINSVENPTGNAIRDPLKGYPMHPNCEQNF